MGPKAHSEITDPSCRRPYSGHRTGQPHQIPWFRCSEAVCNRSEKKLWSKAMEEGNYRCVECGSPIKTLYIQYSPGNIRLMKCGICKAVADEYIECEIMIIAIDLILHKPNSYRHLFYNMLSRSTLEGLFWKLSLGLLILDAYRMWVLTAIKDEWIWCLGKFFTSVIVGNLFFVSVLLFGSAKFLNYSSSSSSTSLGKWKDPILAILISSYFKIFLVAMMVWEFPPSVIFIVDMFVLSSNTIALNVITDSASIKCLGVCLAAFSVKFLSSHGVLTLWWNYHPSKLFSFMQICSVKDGKNIKIHKYFFTKLKSFGPDTLLCLPVRVKCFVEMP